MENVDDISLHNICYQYPNTAKPAINNISVSFEKGQLNTIAGPSGSGKSTLADIILGLLPAASGELETNKEAITGDMIFSYQRSIGLRTSAHFYPR